MHEFQCIVSVVLLIICNHHFLILLPDTAQDLSPERINLIPRVSHDAAMRRIPFKIPAELHEDDDYADEMVGPVYQKLAGALALWPNQKVSDESDGALDEKVG